MNRSANQGAIRHPRLNQTAPGKNGQRRRCSICLSCTKSAVKISQTPKSKKKMMVWEQIAQKMAQRGYKYPSNKCEVKFKNLKQKYTKTVDHNNQTGNTPKKRSFYEQLADIFPFNPFVQPVAECANLVGFKKNVTSSRE